VNPGNKQAEEKFKQVGEAVTENEPLLEINTDKVTVEVAAPATGVLREILKTPEQAVEPGEVLGRIEAGAAPTATSPATAKAAAAHAPPSPEAPAAAAELTPAVRRLLAEHGLEASSIHGSGKGGRITVQDVEAHIAGRDGPPKAGPAAGSSRRVPHSAMRRTIAQHMVQSVAVAPHVTAVFEADLSAIVAHRETNRGAFEAEGANLTYTAYFVRASVAALPGVRSSDEALAASRPFIAQLRALFSPSELRGTAQVLRAQIPNLADFNRVSLPLLDEGRQLSACTNNVLVPFVESRIPDPDFPANTDHRVVEQMQHSFPNLAGESRLSDGNNQTFHAGPVAPGPNVRPAPPTCVAPAVTT